MKFKVFLLYFCIVLMVLFAYFQWNDPDPYLWIPIYLFVAYMAYRKLKFDDPAMVFLGPAFLYFLWGLSLYPEMWEGVMLNEMGMKTTNIELGRESWGLFINAGLLLVFAFLPKKA